MEDFRLEQDALEEQVAARLPEARTGENKQRLLDEITPHFDAVRDAYLKELVALSRLSLPSEYAAMAARVGDRLRILEDVRADVQSMIDNGTLAAHEAAEAQSRLDRLADYFRRDVA